MRAAEFSILLVLMSTAFHDSIGQAPQASQPTAIATMDPGLRDVIERFAADEDALERKYPRPRSEPRRNRLRSFYAEAQKSLAALPFDSLGVDGRVDWHLLRAYVARRQKALDREQQRAADAAPLLPFRDAILSLVDARLRFEAVVPKDAAANLDAIAKSLPDVERRLDSGELDSVDVVRANRTVGQLRELRGAFRGWYDYFAGYEPTFEWWCRKPFEACTEGLDRLSAKVQERLISKRTQNASAPLIADPIGDVALREELGFEFIPYSPPELVAIAEREFAWCDAEMAKATQALGFGDDWRKAQEHVKELHVEPGRQPDMVRDMALEAIDWVTKRDLVTVPDLCRETWRMEMMAPADQRVNPFFLGGEVIKVSFPTDAMTQSEKLQSLRANNRHFSRAVVHHELIPGHHLQGFMQQRYRPYRRMFSTPFWVEGWALYWELRLYDMNFAATPEDRIGMLYWRKHRCARIIFSLGIHQGTMSPTEAVKFLVDRVGHEPAAAEGEVRRSINGDYGPLYQAGYMLGGMQIRALQRELVEGGRMSEKSFHDAVLQQNSIPIELIRASLTGTKLAADMGATWRFADGGK